MVPNTVQFTNFTVENPLRVLLQQERNKPAFWPESWTLLLEPNSQNGGVGISKDVNLFAWFRNNCEHQFDISYDLEGRRVFAFESDEEATLFRMTF
jgi:hypothetical protein